MIAKKKSKASMSFKSPEKSKSKESVKSENENKPEFDRAPKKKNIKVLALLGVLIFIILALFTALILVLVLQKSEERKSEERNVCETPDCITLAYRLHNWKDDSVNPCDDFYAYSCGKYNEHALEPPVVKKTKVIHGLIEEFLMKNQTTSSKTENAMKHLFWKCKERENETIWDDVRDNNIKQMREDIKQLGSWPLADSNWNRNSFDLNGLLQKIPSIVGRHRLDISFGLFKVSMPAARKLFIEPTYEIYDVKIIQEVLTDVLGTPPGKSEVQDIDFLIASYKAQNITIPIDDYSKVKSAIPDVNIDLLLQQLLSNNKAKWDKIKDKIYEFNGFHQKAKLIQQLIRDHKRSAANYLIYKYAHTAYSYLPKLETKCHETVIGNLPFPSIRVFVRNHFDKNAMKDVDALVEDMRTNYIDLIENSEILTEKTKKGAIQKMKGMKKTIAYPEEFEVSGALDSIFNIDIKPSDSIYHTMKKIETFSINLLLDYVSSDLPMNPAFQFHVNAFYAKFENSINIHAAIIDDPLFHTSFPKYAKIAGVGSIIGHEIGHAFGPTCVNFDENGNYKKWWDAQDLEKYENRSMCLVDQYEQYDDPHFGKKLNGSLTLNEIISDELGHDVAWRIFKKLDLFQEKKVIGFEDYSIEKLYFQIGATNYCAPRSQHTLQEQLEDPHSTLSFRVNGVFSNKKEFAETFNCPVGSPMNPVKKCKVF